MNKRNWKSPAWNRALRRIRRSPIAGPLLIIIIAVAVIGAFFLFVAEDTRNRETQETAQVVAPLVIDVHDPCTRGMVKVYSGGELVYEYSGEIMIKNDGKNGEEIEIQIEYTEETWPCSCMAE